jgi:hypothetical protein
LGSPRNTTLSSSVQKLSSRNNETAADAILLFMEHFRVQGNLMRGKDRQESEPQQRRVAHPFGKFCPQHSRPDATTDIGHRGVTYLVRRAAQCAARGGPSFAQQRVGLLVSLLSPSIPTAGNANPKCRYLASTWICTKPSARSDRLSSLIFRVS